MPGNQDDDKTKDITDVRPLALHVVNTVSQATIAISVLLYVLYKIFYCACAGM